MDWELGLWIGMGKLNWGIRLGIEISDLNRDLNWELG